MLDTVISYSAKPIEHYPWLAQSRLIGRDPLAWNLAWASYDWDQGPHPDPQFTSCIYHTAGAILATGLPDLTQSAPEHATVRSKLRMPPPQFVRWLAQYRSLARLPLAQRYGAAWLATLDSRCAGWTDHTVRMPVHVPTTEALRVYRELIEKV